MFYFKDRQIFPQIISHPVLHFQHYLLDCILLVEQFHAQFIPNQYKSY